VRNCPKQEQDARKGKGERGRGGDNVEARLAATEQKIRALQKAEKVEARLAATEKKNRELKKAEKAVAMSNAILREQVASLSATNAMAIRQGLGVYGDLSGDDSEWKAREPYPGKSETLGKSVSQPVQDLQKQLFGARREIEKQKSQLMQVGAGSKRAKRNSATRYVGHGRADDDILPFYEQPAYGGKNLVKAVREYRREVAKGVAVPY